jgi:hypothetical protein
MYEVDKNLVYDSSFRISRYQYTERYLSTDGGQEMKVELRKIWDEDAARHQMP